MFLRKILESHREFVQLKVYKASQSDAEIEKVIELVKNINTGNVVKGLIEFSEKRKLKGQTD